MLTTLSNLSAIVVLERDGPLKSAILWNVELWRDVRRSVQGSSFITDPRLIWTDPYT